jgi:glycosyltransferase involved in cell wall biosynthesis
MENPKHPDISVIILCYKSEEAARPFVLEMVDILDNRGVQYEIILVANYNAGEEHTDTTHIVAKELARENPNIVVVAGEKKGMYGFDVISGLSIAIGNTIAYIDGDGQMPAPDVVRVYDELIKNDVDMAITYRVKRYDSMKRILISRVYNVLLRILFPSVSVYDANAKPKIFTREALEKLDIISNDWFIDPEIVIQASKQHFKIAQIPTVFLKKVYRSSFVNIMTIFEFLRNLFRYRFF